METFLQEAQSLPYWLQFLSVVVLALVGGSFLNVVIFRLPIALFSSNGASGGSAVDLSAGEQHLEHVGIFKILGCPRSYCPTCRTTLRTLDLFPILSFLLLGGKCRYCASPIRYTYPVVEALTALVVGLLFYRLGFGLNFLVAVVLVSFLIVLAAIDIRHMILPDELTMPLLWCGLLVNTTFRVAPLGEAVVGAVFGYLSLFLVNFVFSQLRKKQGLGGGDMKLAAAIGAWFGWITLVEILLFSAVLALLVFLAMYTLGKWTYDTKVPLGPFLSLVAGVAICIPGHRVLLLGFPT